MMATRRKRTPRLHDLEPAPYNPRDMSGEARDALAASLGEFGDIAGITWNQRSGHLVAGHQRLKALRDEHGAQLRMAGGVITTPTGETFPVRVVDWSPEKERAANIAANSPLIAGVFTGDAAAVFDGLDMADELLDALRMPALLDMLVEPDDGDLAATMRALPMDERSSGFRQMTFLLSDAQASTVTAALKHAKGAGAFDESENGNSNGNALGRIAEEYLG